MNLTRFQKVSKRAMDNGHVKMCAPLAMSLVTGETFDDCHDMLNLLGYRPHKRTGTKNGKYSEGLHELGYNTKRHLIPHNIKTNVTLAGRLDPTKEYVIEYSRHVAAYSNGAIEDWTDGRRHRVLGIVEVIHNKGSVGEYLGLTTDLVS